VKGKAKPMEQQHTPVEVKLIQELTLHMYSMYNIRNPNRTACY
jgi:hypothetical protein